ncbi:MAG: phage protein D [Candidatus Abawacabacteria bacterium]|nr:phage protein D [Candidatus Abawacabacteria bacterium]
MSLKVRKPVWILEYDHKDITTEISPFVNSVTYTDNEHGTADEIEINVENSDLRWIDSWYPEKGDIISLMIGYEGEKLLPCGSFEIDECEANGPPDTLTIRGISTNITKALRQKNTKAYENTSLKQIAEEIAQKHGFTIVGNVQNIQFKRKTQKNMTDLSYLRQLAEEYGQVFKIVDNKLVFYEIETLDAANTVHSIDRKQLKSYSLRDKADQTFKACEVNYFNPKTKKLVSASVSTSETKKGDVLKLSERAENKAQAEAKAKAALKRTNNLKTEGTLEFEGEPIVVSGSNINLTGMKKLFGKYAVVKSTHTQFKTDGYSTSVEVRRIA